MAKVSTVYPIQSDKITGYTPGGYPIGDRAISSKDLADIDKEIYSDGIISTAAESGAYYQVVSDTGMNIKVYPGKCYIRGRKVSTPSNTLVTIDDADALLNRTDRVVLRLDLSNEVRDVVIAVKKGDTSLTRTSSVWELGLADILVKKGVTSISQSNITDLRFDSNVCGRAYNELLKVDTTGIFNQMQAIVSEQESKWEQQTDRQQADWSVQTQERKGDYSDWKNDFLSWYTAIRHDISKLQTFCFDNLTALDEANKKTVFGTNTVTETIRNPNNQNKVAERVTTFVDSSTITEVTTVYDTDGVSVFKQATQTTKFNADGSIDDTAKGFGDYTLNAAYVGGITIDGDIVE